MQTIGGQCGQMTVHTTQSSMRTIHVNADNASVHHVSRKCLFRKCGVHCHWAFIAVTTSQCAQRLARCGSNNIIGPRCRNATGANTL